MVKKLAPWKSQTQKQVHPWFRKSHKCLSQKQYILLAVASAYLCYKVKIVTNNNEPVFEWYCHYGPLLFNFRDFLIVLLSLFKPSGFPVFEDLILFDFEVLLGSLFPFPSSSPAASVSLISSIGEDSNISANIEVKEKI